jgi:hypothetical protein
MNKEEMRDEYKAKLRASRELLNGLLDIMEKTFDSMFELEWAITEQEVDGKLVPKKEKKVTKKNKVILHPVTFE